MTDQEFFEQVEAFRKNPGIPSKEFCEKYLERLPTEEEIEENYPEALGRDAEDYVARGYALNGIWEEDEDGPYFIVEGDRDLYDIMDEYGL